MKFINFKHSIVVCPLKFSLVFFRHYFPTNQQSAQSLQQQQQLSASAALDNLDCLQWAGLIYGVAGCTGSQL